ncbi:hypothetical protein ACFSKI_19025 [Pseudogracilibacillus auburnensis]|uniref:Uncharacterized protein n=1 Tax=Pseudogracilibacillus auburnensis TaxID=1494959 RepID=A0A2V3WJ33_9BACI|nr:hypothetical protein [Pseudogracilibacillus auburnensis]MBO1005638.1 hypothetical protein [Pseudogracilibacillus auburnensis]PXW88789.1 hypothetical protein DFR56_103295 [Pseudogracilibacillus auburnensis]
MRIIHRVLLPEWAFQSHDKKEIESNIKEYLQRYPDYLFVREENGFAICERT